MKIITIITVIIVFQSKSVMVPADWLMVIDSKELRRIFYLSGQQRLTWPLFCCFFDQKLLYIGILQQSVWRFNHKIQLFFHHQSDAMLLLLCFRVPCHIVHLSSASALPMIRKARADGVPLTIETTHHYLSLTAEDVPEGATQYKCCPPVRDSKNQVGIDVTFIGKNNFNFQLSFVKLDQTYCTTNHKAYCTT